MGGIGPEADFHPSPHEYDSATYNHLQWDISHYCLGIPKRIRLTQLYS